MAFKLNLWLCLFCFCFYSCTYGQSTLNTNDWKEDDYNDYYAKQIGGQRETKKYYTLKNKQHHVKVDIETETEVIEGGKDKRSSLDSVQQALFFAFLTGKKPVVVIYDTDNTLGNYEYRIQQACKLANVEYRRISFP